MKMIQMDLLIQQMQMIYLVNKEYKQTSFIKEVIKTNK